jgi:sugar phosphate isomerase/epimerase
MKLGVITDGIDQDYTRVVEVMRETGARYAELQTVWDQEIGDHTREEVAEIRRINDANGIEVPILSPYAFRGLPIGIEPSDAAYQNEVRKLKAVLDVAEVLGTPLVRILTFTKVPTMWGFHGFDYHLSNNNTSWSKFLKLMEIPVGLAADRNVTLCFETGTSQVITSCYLARKLITDLGADNLKVLWDVANAMYVQESPYPDGYEAIREHLAHVHLKDWKTDLVRSEADAVPLGQGEVGPYLEDIAAALRADDYQGVISLESVYRPDGGTWEDGYRASWPTLERIFG